MLPSAREGVPPRDAMPQFLILTTRSRAPSCFARKAWRAERETIGRAEGVAIKNLAPTRRPTAFRLDRAFKGEL